jgi:hypothetical protein
MYMEYVELHIKFAFGTHEWNRVSGRFFIQLIVTKRATLRNDSNERSNSVTQRGILLSTIRVNKNDRGFQR